MKWVVAGLCSYETVAICSGKFPTLTELNKRHKVIGITILGGLTVHFYRNGV